MTNVFRSALVNFPSELPDIFYFFIVKLAPDFEAMETGVGHEVSVKAIAKATGKTPKEIRTLYQDEGDLGAVAAKCKSTTGTLGGFFKKATPAAKKILTFDHVFQEFRKIAKTSGDKSATLKEGMIVQLIQNSSNDEAIYIIRFLQKTLKTGAAEKTVINALARAIVYTPPNKPGVLNQKKKLGDDEFFKLCDELEYSIK
jgi:DNA ligase-1